MSGVTKILYKDNFKVIFVVIVCDAPERNKVSVFPL